MKASFTDYIQQETLSTITDVTDGDITKDVVLGDDTITIVLKK